MVLPTSPLYRGTLAAKSPYHPDSYLKNQTDSEKEKLVLSEEVNSIYPFPRRVCSFSISERKQIIEEYLNGNMSKVEIWKKYTGLAEKGHLIRWMRKLGYTDRKKMRINKNRNQDNIEHKYFEEKYRKLLNELKNKNNEITAFKNENTTLKNKNAELEKSNDDLNIRAVFAETLIEVIEEEHNIKIKKKLNSKH